MNKKSSGEKGERIAIGELAKWDIDVAIPLSDNLPWDFVIIHGNKLFRTQVKSGERRHRSSPDSICFGLTTNNWHAKTTKKYTSKDCDLMILCDYENIYLLGPQDFSGKSCFSIRQQKSKNGQTKGIHMHDDFVISKKRIRQILK